MVKRFKFTRDVRRVHNVTEVFEVVCDTEEEALGLLKDSPSPYAYYCNDDENTEGDTLSEDQFNLFETNDL